MDVSTVDAETSKAIAEAVRATGAQFLEVLFLFKAVSFSDQLEVRCVFIKLVNNYTPDFQLITKDQSLMAKLSSDESLTAC